jgi:hypothetical protein
MIDIILEFAFGTILSLFVFMAVIMMQLTLRETLELVIEAKLGV